MSTILSLNIHAPRPFVLVWRASVCLFWDASGLVVQSGNSLLLQDGCRGSGSLFTNQRQEEFLQSLALGEIQAVKLNSHLASTQNADDRTRGNHGPHAPREVQAYAHWRTRRKDVTSLDQHASRAEINRLAFKVFPAKPKLHSGLKRNAPGPASIIFHGSLSGPNQP